MTGSVHAHFADAIKPTTQKYLNPLPRRKCGYEKNHPISANVSLLSRPDSFSYSGDGEDRPHRQPFDINPDHKQTHINTAFLKMCY